MLKVTKHGLKNRVVNPATGKEQDVINVTFQELSTRSGGANPSMSETSDFLSQAVGKKVGLDIIRVHTHPVLADTIGDFTIGKEFPQLFINRKLFSTPQMKQQVGVGAREIDGKPTYFTTFISNRELPDEDLRMSNEALAKVKPEEFTNVRVSAATVIQAVELSEQALQEANQ